MTDQEAVIEALIARVSRLDHLLDESALNEVALIATLKELLPGFGPRFDKLRRAAQTTVSPDNPQGLAELRKALEKRKGKQH